MPNILINGLKAKTGGGRSILQDYLAVLRRSSSNNTYYVLTPDSKGYSEYSSDSITIIDLGNLYERNILFPLLYFRKLPQLLSRYKIDCIFNLGDIVIPTSIPQLYLFDWPYAVYPNSIVWERMEIMDLITRLTKRRMIARYIGCASLVIAQTTTMRERLMAAFALKRVEVVPNALALAYTDSCKHRDFHLPKDRLRLLYPTNYAPHKNVEVLIPLAERIRDANLPYCVVVTIEGGQHRLAKRFLRSVVKQGLEEVIRNVGQVETSMMPSLYGQCDALLMPTLLESYGLPYIEAMYHKKPILTSNYDFARDVCGEAAFYFDPLDVESIVVAINYAFGDIGERLKKQEVGDAKIAGLLTWQEVFARYDDLLACLADH